MAFSESQLTEKSRDRRSMLNKNRVPLYVRSKTITDCSMMGSEIKAEAKSEEILELVFDTSYRSKYEVERIFGRMHFKTYERFEYPFETAVLQFWKALDWHETTVVEKKKVPTGKFKQKSVSDALFQKLDKDDWVGRGKPNIKGLLNSIESFLFAPENYGKITKSDVPEKILGTTEIALLKQSLQEEITSLVQKHMKDLRMVGDEIMMEEVLEKKRLEIEFDNLVVVVDDNKSKALLYGMKECVLEIKKKIELLRHWRLNGVDPDERDYVFFWDRPGNDPTKKPENFTGPFDHQWVMYKTHTLLNSSADLSDMGTGKTLSCLMTIDKRIQDGEVRKGHVLVVAPTTTLELAWQKQIEKFTPHLTSTVVKGSYTQRMHIFLDSAEARGDILLINYEAFAMDTKLKKKDGTDKVVPLSKLCGLVPWDMVVLDECHKIKNPEAKRTGRIIDTFRESEHKLIMSGTINANKLHDIHTPFVHLNRAVNFNSRHHTRDGTELTLGELHGEFKSAYFSGSGINPVPLDGTIEELREKLEEISVRFEKKECLSLPDKMYVMDKLEMSPKQKQLYNALRDMLIADLSDIQERGGRVTAINILAKLTKLAEAANGWIYNNNHEVVELPWNPKLERVKEIIDDIDLETQKVVIWSRFTHDLHLISDTLREKYGDDAVVVIHGGGACRCGSNSVRRSDHINQFLDMSEGHKVKIAVLNQATGSHGIDLTSATYEIFYSNSFSKTDRLQSEDRCHRTGMRESLTIIDLVCKETVDEQVMQALMTHKAMTTALLESLGLGLDLDFDSDSDSPDRADEPPVIQIQQQGREECLLASCAMIAGKTIQEARQVLQELKIYSWRGTYENMLKVLNYWGVEVQSAWDMKDESRKGIATVKWPDGRGHAVAFHSGQIYDPMYDEPKALRLWLASAIERGGKISQIMVVVS